MKRTSGILALRTVAPVRLSGPLGLCVCSCALGCGDSGTGYQTSGGAGPGATTMASVATTVTGTATTTATMTTTVSVGPNTAAISAASSGTTAEAADTAAGGSGGSANVSGSGGTAAVDGSDAGGADGAGGAGGTAGVGGAGGNSGASAAGGSGGSNAAATSSGGAGGTDSGSEGVLGIIAVGYGGLRIVTRDLGETWEDETHWSEDGGDDHDLLRTIAYGSGLWVSGGWRLTTSKDGVIWTDHGDAEDVIDAVNCPVTDGMAFGNGRFLVACGSTLAASSDGLSWERVGPTPDVGGHPHLVFDEATEQFACSGDDGASYVSSDGEAWTEIEMDSVRLCDGLAPEAECPSFYYEGVYLSTEWGGWIRRSTSGEDFMTTYSDQFGNNLFTEYAFAVGRVAP